MALHRWVGTGWAALDDLTTFQNAALTPTLHTLENTSLVVKALLCCGFNVAGSDNFGGKSFFVVTSGTAPAVWCDCETGVHLQPWSEVQGI